MPRRCLVPEGSLQKSRGRHRGGNRKSIQRRLAACHLDDLNGYDAQVAGARADSGDVDRRRAGTACAQEFQQPEGDRVRFTEQSRVPIGKMLAVHAAGETRALPRTGKDIFRGEQRLDAARTAHQGGYR